MANVNSKELLSLYLTNAELLIQLCSTEGLTDFSESIRLDKKHHKLLEAWDLIQKVDLPEDSVFYPLLLVHKAYLEMRLGRAPNSSYFEKSLGYSSNKYLVLLINYIYYSWYFWIDASKSNEFLHRLILNALTNLEGRFLLQGIFLKAHMNVIHGKYIPVNFFIARSVFKLTGLLRSVGFKPHFADNIIFSAFPYTVLVSKNIQSLVKTNHVCERFRSHDPYYSVLYRISSLYGYAYGGRVKETFTYANGFVKENKDASLIRYRSLASIMRLVPIFLQGYGRFVINELNSLIKSHDPQKASNLVNSQVFRASALCNLLVRNFVASEELITKAIEYRKLTKSFIAWEGIDREILRQSQAGRVRIEKITDLLGVKEEKNKRQLSTGVFISDLYSRLDSYIALDNAQLVKAISDEICGYYDCEVAPAESSENIFSLSIPDLATLNFRVTNKNTQSELSITMPVIEVIMADFCKRIRLLKRAIDQAEESKLADVARSVAHDIRAPIAALETVARTFNTVDKEKLELVNLAIKRIRNIAEDLLSSKKTSQAESPALPGTFDASQALEEIIAEKSHRAKINSIEIAYKKLSGPGMVNGVEESFKRVISNLVENSFEAMENANQKKIEFEFYESSKLPYLFLRIKDTGHGISEKLSGKLLNEKISSKPQGHGLGLVSAKQTLNSWKGDISLETTGPEGTCFLLALVKSR